MIQSKFLDSITNIDNYRDAAQKLVQANKVQLPFNYLELPFIWWDNFKSVDDIDFGTRRGRNFWGDKSWLRDLKLLVSYDGEDIVGIVPLVEIEFALSGETDSIKMLSFAGDSVLIAYQDFLVSPGKRLEILKSMLQELTKIAESTYDILFLGYVPEQSENLFLLSQLITEKFNQNWRYGIIKNKRKGGIYPWTIGGITYNLKNIESKMSEESLDTKEVSQVVDKFENTNTGFLFFQKTRQNLNTLLNNCLESVKQFNKFDRQIESIESLLNHEDILYPSIQLPGTRDDYFSSLSRETRRYFRRYGKRFEEAGGEFETIKGNDITEKDVEDFLNLHAERWKDESAAVSNRTLNFHQELVNKLSKENRYSLFFAKYEGKRIASHACMDYGKYREAYFNGRDPEFEELRAGRLLYLETIMDAIDNDFETYNLGLGGDRYKLSFSNQVHTVSNILLMPGKKSIDLERVFPNYEYINI